ncbi:MAG TPA: hypothetical protein C5S51_12015 [Methanosarcinaceae archaeon]|nr:hypothetical protein [Methanosarcinaceae archaeon]
MSVENRDFVIERLERQLQDKDSEFEELKVTLRDSIMTELRRDLQNDLDMNNRLTKIEQKVSDLSNTLSGMMDELLDQKSELRSIKNIAGHKNSNNTSIIQKENANLAVQKPVLKPQTQPNTIVQPHIPNTPTQPRVTASMSRPNSAEARNPNKAQFNIREVKRVETEPKIPEPEPKTEYIIADSGKEYPGHRVNRDRSSTKSNRSEYIIADDKKNVRRESQTEHGVESVEKRDGEDVEIVTTRKKLDF